MAAAAMAKITFLCCLKLNAANVNDCHSNESIFLLKLLAFLG